MRATCERFDTSSAIRAAYRRRLNATTNLPAADLLILRDEGQRSADRHGSGVVQFECTRKDE
jgi:hypothetical protein